jgi:hypothetical protein
MISTIALVLLVGIAIPMNGVIFENHSVSLASVTEMKNINFIASGYNIFGGNPYESPYDPGLLRKKIYDL